MSPYHRLEYFFISYSQPFVLGRVFQSLRKRKVKQKTAKGIKDMVLAEKREGQPFSTELILFMLWDVGSLRTPPQDSPTVTPAPNHKELWDNQPPHGFFARLLYGEMALGVEQWESQPGSITWAQL